MTGITQKMNDTLVKLYGDDYANFQSEHRARMTMINTLLGEGLRGEFTSYEDSRNEALDKVNVLSEIYDVQVKENTEHGYFHFSSDFNWSIYHGMSAKIYYPVD